MYDVKQLLNEFVSRKRSTFPKISYSLFNRTAVETVDSLNELQGQFMGPTPSK